MPPVIDFEDEFTKYYCHSLKADGSKNVCSGVSYTMWCGPKTSCVKDAATCTGPPLTEVPKVANAALLAAVTTMSWFEDRPIVG